MKKIAFLVLMFLWISVSGWTDSVLSGNWKYIGPEGGKIQKLVPDRRHPQTWFAIAGENRTLYFSADSARHWNSTHLVGVSDVASHPATSEVLAVIAAKSGKNSVAEIWESRDQGAHFGFRNKVGFPLSRLVFDPSSVSTTYGISEHELEDSTPNLWVSHDGGSAWKNLPFAPFPLGSKYPYVKPCTVEGYGMQEILPALSGATVLYAQIEVELSCPGESASDSLFIQSSNQGHTWQAIASGEFEFSYDPLFPARAFVFGYEHDGSKTFPRIKEIGKSGVVNISNQPMKELAAASIDPKDLIGVGADTTILRSNDEGRTWHSTIAPTLHGDVQQFVFLDSSARSVMAGTNEGGVCSLSTDNVWTRHSVGIRQSEISTLAQSGSSLYSLAGQALDFLRNGAFLYSRTSTGDWVNKGFRVPDDARIQSISVSPANPNLILAVFETLQSNGGGVLVSQDGGKTWAHSDLPNGFYKHVFFHPTDVGQAYVTVQEQSVFKTTDGGAHFAAVPIQFADAVTAIVFDENNPATLFFLSGKFVYRSQDSGATAVKVFSVASANPIDMAPLQERNGFLMTDSKGKIYRTNDGGETWTSVSTVATKPLKMIAGAPQGSHFFIIGRTSRFGKTSLWESNDAGKHWTNITGEIGDDIQPFDMTDARKSPFYLATNHGVLVSMQK